MKFLAKLLLIILFVPLSLAAVLAATIKFQLLDANFWRSTFKNNNVYTNLSVVVKIAVENQNEKGGGKKSDLKVLTDVITPNIVEDFISHNLDNFLGFANGKRKVLLVYIPKVINFNSEEIPLTALLSKFNITIGQDLPISQIAYAGLASTYSFIGFLALSILCLFLLFILTENGKKFITLGLALLISGLTILGLTLIGFLLKGKIFSSQIILSTFAPYIMQEILRLWITIGIIFLILGIILFLFKKHDSRQI